MKTPFFILSVFFILISLSSCDSSLSEIDEMLPNNSTEVNHASRKINVNVIVNDDFNSTLFYRVELYDKMPSLIDSKLLSVGVARKDMVFNVDVMLSVATQKIYIQHIDPSKNITLMPVSINSKTTIILCNFNTNEVVVK